MNRSCRALLLIAWYAALVASAKAQVFVLSHTNIDGQRNIVPTCETLILDEQTASLYPGVSAACTLNQNGVAIQTLQQSTATIKAVCTATLGSVAEGADYQTTATHGLFLQRLINGCIQNGVLIDCDWDPLNYAIVDPSLAPIPASRQIKDSGNISAAGGQATFWPGGNIHGGDNFLIGVSAETQFESAQIAPSVVHLKAKDLQLYTMSADQNANWTLTGTAGTTSPPAPSQGRSIFFQAPSTVPVQQVDTLTGCKVDTSHGTDCSSAQIIVEVLGVSIPAGNPDDIPPTSNATELLGGEMFQYKAIVTQGAATIDSPVTWSKVDNSGLNLINIDASSGFVTVQPQSVFQGGDFFVDIQATSTIDPAVAFSAPFSIHIPTVAVNYTTLPTPGVNDTPITFEATVGRAFDFAANVSGPINPQNRVITFWNQNFIPTFTDFSEPGVITVDPNEPNSMEYVITSPPPKGNVSTTIRACVGGHLDAISLGLKDATCAEYVLPLSAPVFPTSPPQIINSGESTAVTITGTGFGAAPTFSFSDPTVTFTLTSVSGPDGNGVTTVTGTITAAPTAINARIPLTITSSLPPPSTPVNQSVAVRSVASTAAVIPVNPTLIISQSQQFTASLGCVTFGGQSCTVPQTYTCSLISGPGTISTSCLYTAPASLAAQTQVQAQACFTFGNVCKTFSINLVPVTVAVSPSSVSLGGGQSQQFLSTVTNVPNNNQGTIWSLSPAVGSISSTGLYTAPASVTSNQTITVKVCSSIVPSNCASSNVNLIPPDFALSISPNALDTGLAFEEGTTVTITPIGGFAGTVTLSASTPATDMTASFSPATITGSGTSGVLFPVTAATPGGTYTVTITGTSGGLAHSAQITVTVLIESITVTASAPQTAAAGTTVTFTYNVTDNGFVSIGDAINVTGIPPGSTVIPTPVTGGGGKIEFTTATTLAPGTYLITVTASEGSLTGSASTSLTIPAPLPPPPPPPSPCGVRICIN